MRGSLSVHGSAISRLGYIPAPKRGAVVADRSSVRSDKREQVPRGALRLHYWSVSIEITPRLRFSNPTMRRRPGCLIRKQLAAWIAQSMVNGATRQVAQVEQVGQTSLLELISRVCGRGLCCQALSLRNTGAKSSAKIRTQSRG